MNQLLAIAFLLAACGDDGVNTLPDAPPLPGDSPTDAPPQPVTLTVTIAGTPARDVPVIFQNAQSMVVLATMTDATGKASAVLEPGGFVTALEPQVVADLGGIPLVNDDLTTFSGVKPGDELQLELARGGGSGTDVTFDIVVPEDPNAASYSLYTSCGDVDITPIIVVPVLFGSANNPARSVTLTGCNGMADMAVVTYDASFVPLQSYYQADVAVADAQLVTLAGPYQAIASTSMTVSNPAADLGAINVEHRIATARGSIYETFGSLNQGSTSFTGAIATPVTTNTTAVVRLDVFRTGPDPASNQQVIEWGPTSATYTADWAAIALRVRDVHVNGPRHRIADDGAVS